MLRPVTTAAPSSSAFNLQQSGVYAVGGVSPGAAWGGATLQLQFFLSRNAADNADIWGNVPNGSFTADAIKMLDLGQGKYRWTLTTPGTGAAVSGLVGDN